MSSSNCQFEEGDRIDHKLFGLGMRISAHRGQHFRLMVDGIST